MTMLDKAFEKIPDGTNFILHSDQGWQYQHTAAGGANGSPCGAALLSPKIALISNPSSSGIS